MLEAGRPKLRIAEELGIARDTVDRVAARLGRPASPRSGRKRYDWEAVRRYYATGHSAAATRRRFGITTASWRAAIARGDVEPRDRPLQLPPGSRRAQVAELLKQGLSLAQTAERLGISKPTVCYHARRLGIPPRTDFARRHDWDAIREAYEQGVSARECRRLFGFSQDAWAEAVKRGAIEPRPRRTPLSDMLVAGRVTKRTYLKARLVEAGLKQDRCEGCGIRDWEGESLSLHLHHINGNGRDNRLENLQLLCPNCHSQTDTYGGRNGHRRADAA